MNKQEVTFTGTVLKSWWLMLLLAVVGVGISVILNIYVIAPTYSANATLYVQEQRKEDLTSVNGYNELLAAELIVTDAKALILSDKILKTAADSLGVDVVDFSDAISVTSGNSPRTIVISIEVDDPQFATDSVSAVMKAFASESKKFFPNHEFVVIDQPAYPKDAESGTFIKTTLASGLSGLMIGMLIIMFIAYNKIKTIKEERSLDMPNV